MFEVGIALIGLITWLLFTGVVNVICYGFITLGVMPEWLVAAVLGMNLILGFIGEALVKQLIEAAKTNDGGQDE